jgi:hypothetical protein
VVVGRLSLPVNTIGQVGNTASGSPRTIEAGSQQQTAVPIYKVDPEKVDPATAKIDPVNKAVRDLRIDRVLMRLEQVSSNSARRMGTLRLPPHRPQHTYDDGVRARTKRNNPSR